MSLPVRVGLVMLLASTFVTAARAAQPLSASLVVERGPGAEDCPDTRTLQSIVEQVLERPFANDAGQADLRAAVTFNRASDGYAATLQLDGTKKGQRTLGDRGATCSALAQAVGVTMAMLLDPNAQPPPAEPGPAPQERPSGFAAITAGPAFGFVGAPSLAAGPEVTAGLSRRWAVQLAGHYVLGRSSAFEGGNVRVSLWLGLLRLCRTLNDPASRLVMAACVEGAVGRLHGQGSGYPLSREADMTWLGGGGGLQMVRRVGSRWLLGAGADLLRPLRQQTFSITNAGTAYRSSEMSAVVEVKVGLRIW